MSGSYGACVVAPQLVNASVRLFFCTASLTLFSLSEAQATPPLNIAEFPRPSLDLMDTAPASRFQLTTRSLIGDGNSIPGEGSAHTFELSSYLSLGNGWAVIGYLPTAYVSSGLIGRDEGFVGNIGAGVLQTFHFKLGEGVRDWFLIGWGLELFAPTMSDNMSPQGGPSLLASLRTAAPQLYLPAFFSTRTRFQVGFLSGRFRLLSEFHAVTGFFVAEPNGHASLLTVLGLAAVELTKSVDFYVHAASTTQASGESTIEPPFMLSPGFRFRIGDRFSLGTFTSINFESTTALIVGFDLAFVLPSERKRQGFLGGEFGSEIVPDRL